jgi:hypothetical protein
MRNLPRALLALFFAAIALGAAATDKPGAFGKKLVASHELPADSVAKFVRFNAAQAAKGAKPAGVLADTEDWFGEPLATPSSGNPYTLVVRVSGKAVADGDVGTAWMGGWAADGKTSAKLMTGASQSGAKAGERVTLVGTSGPLSFKEDRTLSPALSFINARNIEIDSVQLEAWSGIGKSTLPQLVFAWSPLLVGLAFLGLFFWFRRGS